MRLLGIFRGYGLMRREKLGGSCRRQFLRLLRMLACHPLGSFRQGILKAMIGLTYDCQCSCAYCCSGLYPRESGKELSAPELLRLIDDIARLPSLGTLVSFFGGEALLKEEVFSLIAHASGRGLFTETETNGILLSVENVKRLKKAGLHHIFVRIESSDPVIHDRVSGVAGCFRSAAEGISSCVAQNLSCSISTIAFRDKIHDGELERIIAMARQLGASSLRILYPTAAGKLAGESDSLLNAEEKRKVCSLLDPDFVYLESTAVCSGEMERVCPSRGNKFFYVSCYGQVQPCPFVPSEFGNIRGERIGQVLERMRKDPRIKERRQIGCLMEDARHS